MRYIKPSKLSDLSQILTPEEMEDVMLKERREGRCVEAAGILIEKLLALQNLNWPDVFLTSLGKNYAPLAVQLRQGYERLKVNIHAAVEIKEDQISTPGPGK